MDILIVGTEHSGIHEVATWLASCTNSHGTPVKVVQEYPPLDAAFAAWQELARWKGFEEEKGKLEFALTRYLLSCYTRHEGIVVDTHELHAKKGLEFIQFVRRFFPACQIVFMTRNGRDVVRKMRQIPHGMGRTKFTPYRRPVRQNLNEWSSVMDTIKDLMPFDIHTRLFYYERLTQKELEDFLELTGTTPLILDQTPTTPLSANDEQRITNELKFHTSDVGYQYGDTPS